jgi:hypothetical protein
MSDEVRYVRRRAIVVDAPCHAVFPWLKQMGFDRGGWYAIDRLEQLFGVGRFATGGSARHIVADLQALEVGDRMPLTRRRWLEVLVVDEPHELLLALPPGRLQWTWRFTLTPLGDDEAHAAGHDPRRGPGRQRSVLQVETVLVLPARTALGRLLVRSAWALFDLGHGLMEWVQLRTIARRAAAAHC